jgi:hypothetical protein
MNVAEKITEGGSHDMATANNRLDARRRRCKIGLTMAHSIQMPVLAVYPGNLGLKGKNEESTIVAG